MNYPPHTSANTLINNKKATLNLTAMPTQIAVTAENRNMTNYNNYVTHGLKIPICETRVNSNADFYKPIIALLL